MFPDVNWYIEPGEDRARWLLERCEPFARGVKSLCTICDPRDMYIRITDHKSYNIDERARWGAKVYVKGQHAGLFTVFYEMLDEEDGEDFWIVQCDRPEHCFSSTRPPWMELERIIQTNEEN
jgi:hypothetical protein